MVKSVVSRSVCDKDAFKPVKKKTIIILMFYNDQKKLCLVISEKLVKMNVMRK